MSSRIIKGLALFIIFLFGCWFWHQSHQAKIPNYPYTSILSFKEADLSKCDSDALILFDMDDTLTSTVDSLPLLKTSDWKFRLQAILKHPSLLLKKYKESYWGKVLMHAERFVIEPDVVPLISQLKNQGAVVMALTSLPSGPLGQITDLPHWRYTAVKNMGITFSQKFLDAQFPHLKSKPVLYQGILCAGKMPKGDFLAAFLDHAQWSPKKIIFFDDNIKNLQSVGEVCTQRQIPFILYHYRRGEDLFKSTWNKEIALNQLDALIKTGKYVTQVKL